MVSSPMEFSDPLQWLGFLIGATLSIIVQGEGQAFFVLMFQAISQRERVVYDLNPLNHVDLRSIPALILAGWAWSRKRFTKPQYFPDSRICSGLVPLAGAISPLLLAGILGTLYALLPGATIQTAVMTSASMAVANLVVPIPPLALGRALCCPFENSIRHQTVAELAGASTITALLILEQWTKWPLLQHWVHSVSAPLSKWVLNG